MTKEEKKKLADKNYREANKERIKAWREANKVKSKEYSKVWREANKQHKAKLDKDYKQKNAKKIKEQNKTYRLNNKRKCNAYRSNRRKTDLLFRININTRVLIQKLFKRNNYTKKSKTYQILGCDFNELKLLLENKFQPWMNWNNYGKYNGQPNYGWDIDHIKPLSSATNEQELIELFHHSNLQPLCSYINRVIKRDLI